MKSQDTVCSGCSKVCAVEVDHQDDRSLRFKARLDEKVNGYWICDHGRDIVKTLESQRQVEALYNGEAIPVAEARDRALSLLSQGFSVLASAFNTQEELELADEMSKEFVGAIARADGEKEDFPEFTIPADKNPNRAGVIKVLGADAFDETKTIKAIEGADTLLILNAIEGYKASETLIKALKTVKNIVLLEAWKSDLSEYATVLIPTAAPTEKQGTFINDQGLERDLNFCTAAPGYAEMDLDILKTLSKALKRVSV